MTTADRSGDSHPSNSGPESAEFVPFASRQGRLALAATVVASGVAFLDSTVVTVALPAMGEDLGAGFSSLQWVLDAYLLTLGALVLVGGALGDARGLRRVFVWGIVGFGVASVLCAIAPSSSALIAARAFQGIAAALLTPASLAVLSTTFSPLDRAKAIGAWSGLAGATSAFGPFLGGWLVDNVSWRWIFAINIPLLALAYWLTKQSVPELPGSGRKVDWVGAGLTMTGLALVVGPLIEYNRLPLPVVIGAVVAGLAILGGFVVYESRAADPMLPPALFRIRTFSVANLITFVVYAALGAAGFLLTLGLQRGLGYSALAAGAATVPITVMLLLFSSPVGGMLPRLGPRLLLTVGSLLIGTGLAWNAHGLTAVPPGEVSYWTDVLPGVLVMSVGLVLVVTPVTATTLQDVPSQRQGVASGTSNAVARIAALMAIAALPLASGLATANLDDPDAVLTTVAGALVGAAILCAVGALVASTLLPRRT